MKCAELSFKIRNKKIKFGEMCYLLNGFDYVEIKSYYKEEVIYEGLFEKIDMDKQFFEFVVKRIVPMLGFSNSIVIYLENEEI